MMTEHINADTLIGYIHNTLDGAERESLEQHLSICAECRCQLEKHQQHRQQIQSALHAELRAAKPAQRADFRSLAPQLERAARRPHSPLNRQLPGFLSNAAALAGLAITVLTLSRHITWTAESFGSVKDAPLGMPLSAGLLLGLPIVDNYRKQHRLSPEKLWTLLLTVTLWLGSALLGLYEILLVREVIFRLYARISPITETIRGQAQALTLGNWGAFIMGGLWIVAIIGGAECHYHNLGKERSWRWFAWVVGSELMILALAYFI